MILYIFQAFYEVWRRAREHRKLRHFITAKKTRENTRLLYRLSVISYYRRVFDMFFHVFFNGKTCDFQPYKKAGKLPYKRETGMVTSQRLCNRIAFCMANLHFSSRFTVICWRKKTTVKLDRKKQRQVGVGGWGFLALSLGKKHSPTPCDRRAGWVVVVGLGWVGLGWL